MKISCTDTGKRFNRDWIFRHVNFQFSPGSHVAITGPNGSGKSTLLQVIAGAVIPSEGKIGYAVNNKEIPGDAVYASLSIAAPYLDIIEEMTLIEFMQFHQLFKPFLRGVDVKSVIESTGLGQAAGKQIRYFSSGMKQRVKLAQAIFSDTPCVLLDEPCTNLDDAGIALYHHLIQAYCTNRLVIVSSNDKQEYSFCNEVLNIMEYKG